jgi:hypothetical protein
VKTDSPEPGDLLKQVVDAAAHFGKPRGVLKRNVRPARGQPLVATARSVRRVIRRFHSRSPFTYAARLGTGVSLDITSIGGRRGVRQSAGGGATVHLEVRK